MVLAHRLTRLLTNARKTGTIHGLGPDGKAQVSVEYQGGAPYRIAAVVVSSGSTLVVISPATMIFPAVAMTSQATRAAGSLIRQASRTLSAMASHSLSGWPSVTDSAVRIY